MLTGRCRGVKDGTSATGPTVRDTARTYELGIAAETLHGDGHLCQRVILRDRVRVSGYSWRDGNGRRLLRRKASLRVRV